MDVLENMDASMTEYELHGLTSLDIESRSPYSLTAVRGLDHNDKILSIALTSDCKLVASGGHGNTAGLWDTASGKQICTMPLSGSVLALTFSPNDEMLVSGDGKGYSTVWSTSRRELM